MVAAPPSPGDVVDYAVLAKDLAASSPLEIMDTALDLFGKNIAIAFRCGGSERPWLLIVVPKICGF